MICWKETAAREDEERLRTEVAPYVDLHLTEAMQDVGRRVSYQSSQGQLDEEQVV